MIVSLEKVTVYGLEREKQEILSDLQDIGCLHVVSLRATPDKKKSGPSSESREALKFLLTCPHRRHQVHDPRKFNVEEVETKTLELRRVIDLVSDKRDFLRKRIQSLRPWGDFEYPEPKEIGHLRLWFYVVPNHLKRHIKGPDLVWEIVGHDARFSYVVVIAKDEPTGMPVNRTHTGDRSLSELEDQLEDVLLELEDLQAARASLTRWCTLFSNKIYHLEDTADRFVVAEKTYDQDEIFALQAWAPKEKRDVVEKYARDKRLVFEVEKPKPEEKPPTLLRNPPWISSGQDLVSFYMTPGYWVWDPSEIVFFSFALFFGMILGDAGYGLILAGFLALGWRRMGHSIMGRRLRILFAFLCLATVFWGVILGNYFGVELKKGSFLEGLKLLELDNYMSMMKLVILMGAAHLILANVAYAWRKRRSLRALAPAGWVVIFLGAISVWQGPVITGSGTWKTGGFIAMIAGAVCVLFFSHTEGGFGKRMLGGFHGITNLSAAFGDTLSYLRLFALLLATASLATTFNGLADQVYDDLGVFGVLFAMLVLVIGHGLNILLGVTGGFIHGLRLNFIEFFKWATPEEGYPFQAFARKEKSTWKT